MKKVIITRRPLGSSLPWEIRDAETRSFITAFRTKAKAQTHARRLRTIHVASVNPYALKSDARGMLKAVA